VLRPPPAPGGIDSLTLFERTRSDATARVGAVRVRASSLLSLPSTVRCEDFGSAPKHELIPFSDGTGEVFPVGPGVSLIQDGDRVADASCRNGSRFHR